MSRIICRLYVCDMYIYIHYVFFLRGHPLHSRNGMANGGGCFGVTSFAADDAAATWFERSSWVKQQKTARTWWWWWNEISQADSTETQEAFGLNIACVLPRKRNEFHQGKLLDNKPQTGDSMPTRMEIPTNESGSIVTASTWRQPTGTVQTIEIETMLQFYRFTARLGKRHHSMILHVFSLFDI